MIALATQDKLNGPGICAFSVALHSVGVLLPRPADLRSPWRTGRLPDVQILTGIVGLQLWMSSLINAALIGGLAVSIQNLIAARKGTVGGHCFWLG